MSCHTNQKGFTLTEIIIAIVIFGILAILVVPKIIQHPGETKIVKAKQDILNIENELDAYKLDNGSFPSNAQGLQALVAKPTLPPLPSNWQKEGYLKQLPVDPWGNPYQYKNPGDHEEVDVFSYGPTGKPGGQVIGNWTTENNN